MPPKRERGAIAPDDPLSPDAGSAIATSSGGAQPKRMRSNVFGAIAKLKDASVYNKPTANVVVVVETGNTAFLAAVHCYANEAGVGKRVASNLAPARKRLAKVCSQNVHCKFMLGFMMLRDDGGPQSLGEGTTLVEAAASEGFAQAKDFLAMNVEERASFVPASPPC